LIHNSLSTILVDNVFKGERMPSCSVRPVEVIAADLHKVHYECCLATEQTPEAARAKCPDCDTLSRKVQRRTVESLLKPDRKLLLGTVQYYLCPDAQCGVVYFSSNNSQKIRRDDMSVKVFSKDSGDDVPVCYCFGWTRKRIRTEISNTGKSSAALSIAQEIHAGGCACDLKNPKGECCLGDVHMIVKDLLLPARQ
jgi:hypothetical protein